MKLNISLVLVATYIVAACTIGRGSLANTAPVTVMEGVARQVQACWFGKQDKRFQDYSLQAELTSLSNRPRILLVPRRNQTALPVLVAQAQVKAGRTHFESFGPLLSQPSGRAISRELNAWANGSKSC